MTLDAKRLWAKSAPPVGLFDHLKDVKDAGEAAVGAIGPDLCAAVPDVTDGLPRLLSVACWLHDLLKATTAFQRMVTGGGPIKQPIRHETLAAVLLATHEPLRSWLELAVPKAADRWAVMWAVAGHHLKMADPARCPTCKLVRDVDEPRFKAVLGAADIREALEAADPGVGVPRLDDLSLDTADEDEPGCLRERADRYLRDSAAAWRQLKQDPRAKARVALLKGLLIAADVAGSAAPEKQVSPAEWTRTALGLRLSVADLEPVIRTGTKGKRTLKFQNDVGASDKPVTLVAAGCGSGKTTAAYMWAQRWAVGKKLFFTYPTTGTATAGYTSYLADQQGLPTDLMHMRAGIDLEAMGKTRDDPSDEAVVRIDSLRVWDRKVVVCTVDTVLGLLQCQRRGLYSLPAFLAGAVVFDEVHSYDRRLFGGLLRFLQEFPGIPALIMSASIPPGRLTQLHSVLGKRAGEVIRGDPAMERHKRYRLESRESEEKSWDDVEKALAAGKKILWVCNTVGDAIEIAGQAKTRDGVTRTGVKPIVYHSRFQYKDRSGRQNEVIAEFTGSSVVNIPNQAARVRPGNRVSWMNALNRSGRCLASISSSTT